MGIDDAENNATISRAKKNKFDYVQPKHYKSGYIGFNVSEIVYVKIRFTKSTKTKN